MLAVGRDVDHRLARPVARPAHEQGQPEQRHQRDGGRHRPPGARPRRAATARHRCRRPAQPLPVASGSTSHASTTGASTTASEASPVTHPDDQPRATSRRSRPAAPRHPRRASSDPGSTERRRSLTVIATQCARQRPEAVRATPSPRTPPTPPRNPHLTRSPRSARVEGRAGAGDGTEIELGRDRQAESPCMISRIRSAVSDGVLPTLTPAASRASFLACAVPDEPDTMAPAWPIVLPSGAVNPAT